MNNQLSKTFKLYYMHLFIGNFDILMQELYTCWWQNNITLLSNNHTCTIAIPQQSMHMQTH